MIPITIPKTLRGLALFAFLCAGVTFATGTPPSAEAVKGEAKGEAKGDAGEDAGGLQAAKFMPLGKPNLKVRIPQFKDGVLECVMRAEEMTRVGDEDIDIKSMDIEFVEDGVPTMTIELSEANYNLTERLISSDQRAVVRRADFTLVGDSLDFDTVKRRGRMVGKVRMVIHDASGMVAGGGEETDVAVAADGMAEAARAVAAEARSGPWVARVTLALTTTLKERAERERENEKSDEKTDP